MVAATKHTTFDGATEGVAATAANTATGSGDPMPSVSGSGGTGTILADAAIRGAKGVRIAGTATSWFWDRAVTVGSGYVGDRLYFKIDSTTLVNSASLSFMQIRNSAGAMVSAILNSSRVLALQDNGGGTVVTFNGGTALPTGSYMLWFSVKKGTTTSNGEVYWTLLNAATGATIDTGSSLVRNTGTTDVTVVRYGKTSSTGNLSNFDIDSPAHVEGSNAMIDLVSNNVPPTVSLGSDFTVDPNLVDTFTLTATAADSDGTIVSYLWRDVTAGVDSPGAGSGNIRIIPVTRTTAGSARIYRCTVTDNGGATASIDINVTFLPHTRWVKTSGGLAPLRRIV